MRLATWNVNSLRSRIDRVEALLERHDIDVLALQETKAREDQLPLMGLQSMGYDLAYGRQQPVERRRDPQPGRDRGRRGRVRRACPEWGDPIAAEARAIGATCGGVRVWSLYVPNGRKVDDPHYVYKLDWLARLREAAPAGGRTWRWSATGTSPRSDEDVFDMAAFAKDTHVTPPERAAFQAFLDDGWSRRRAPAHPGPDVFTYWDYYRQRFERNRGMRIDFVLGSPSFAPRVTGAFIDRDERAGTGASDHAPVIVDLD